MTDPSLNQPWPPPTPSEEPDSFNWGPRLHIIRWHEVVLLVLLVISVAVGSYTFGNMRGVESAASAASQGEPISTPDTSTPDQDACTTTVTFRMRSNESCDPGTSTVLESYRQYAVTLGKVHVSETLCVIDPQSDVVFHGVVLATNPDLNTITMHYFGEDRSEENADYFGLSNPSTSPLFTVAITDCPW